MEKWYSAKDLAGIAGMPTSVRGVQLKAKREGWLAKYSEGQGGGLEYHYNALPEETRDALYHQHSNTLPVQSCTDLVATEEIKVDLTSLKKWQRDIFAARLALYREFERLLDLHGYTRAVDKLVLFAKTNSLPEHLQQMVALANARKGKTRTISASMVKGWHRAVKRNGITALAPKPARKDQVPTWASYFHKVFNRPQKPSLSEALRELEAILPEDIKLPSYHQVRRYHKNRSRLEREKGRHSAPAMKRFKGYIRRSIDNLLPLDVVQCDGHSFKAKVNHPVHGRPFKPEVCAVIDVKTKMALGWSAGLAESSHTVADALRHSMTVNESKPWGGVPSILYTDKGAGNMAAMLGDEVTGILSRAGTTHHTGIPGNAQGRGLVEKTNQQLWIAPARKLQTFVGNGMDELEKRNTYLLMEKEVRKTGTCRLSDLPSWAQFLEICEQAVRDYNNKPHNGLPKVKDAATGRIRNMTPFESWFTTIREGWKPTLLDTNVLEDLFRPQVVRITRRAQVSIFNNIYYDSVLEHYHGEKIIVEYNIHDPQAVRVRDMEQRLICVAQLDRNKKDFFPVSEIERSREQRAKGRLALIERKRVEIEAERTGITMDGDTDFLIEADPGAVDRQMLTGSNQDIQMIQHDLIPPEVIVPEQIQSQRQKTKVHQLVSTESERFNLLHGELRADPRPLHQEECEFLNEYYQKDGGKLYLKMVGDLRQEYGVTEEGNEATL
jgi:putative transposase